MYGLKPVPFKLTHYQIMELFCELNRQGTTIVQVTHSEENARYGKRIVELRDGWVTRDEALQTAATEAR